MLTSTEYANTIRDLFSDPAQQVPALVADVSPALAEQHLQAAEQIAARAAASLPRLMGCDPATGGAACVRKFVTDFGTRAFRRPLEPAQVTLYEGLYARTRAAADDRTAAELVVQAVLQSPSFLYRLEMGAPARPGDLVAPLTPHELAARLSYFFTDTMPDAELTLAAQSGRLATIGDVAREAQRLLAKPAAKQVVTRFGERWLDYGHVESAQKAPAPGYTAALLPLMREETRLFIEDVVFNGRAADLFSSATTFANRALATFYGAPPPAGAGFERVKHDPARRAGVLTHASLMASNAEAAQTHPVLRGKLVRTRLLCEALPDTPPGLDVRAPNVTPGQTGRQRWAEHASDPTCAACHRMMDPIGFGFEHYDAVGGWRDREQGQPIDATGEIVGSDVGGRFAGAVELGAKLAASAQARGCVVTQWFRFAFGRLETAQDACTLATLSDGFARSGGRVAELLVSLAASPAFTSRRISN
jgi:hypothetical protein